MDYSIMADYDRFHQGLELPDDRESTPRQNLSIVCGMCSHFEIISTRNPTRGYCKARLEADTSDALRAVHPEQQSNDLACPKVEVICEF